MPTQLEDLERRLPPLLKEFGPDNPCVKGLQAQLSAARRHSKGLFAVPVRDPLPLLLVPQSCSQPVGHLEQELRVRRSALFPAQARRRFGLVDPIIRYHPDIGLLFFDLDVYRY